MSLVRRVFVEKRPGFDVEARHLLSELRDILGLGSLQELRLFKRYDLSGLEDSEYIAARDSILSEPNCDFVYDEQLPELSATVFAVELLPGQYDQRADSAAQCIQLLTCKERPLVRVATVYAFSGEISSEQLQKIKNHLINPVECREAAPKKPETLQMQAETPPDVAILEDFLQLDKVGLEAMISQLGLAMSYEDLAFCQKYFRDEEKRAPSYTELRVIDTYWSDHCRHTTFHTIIDQVDFPDDPLTAPIRADYQRYLELRNSLGRANRDLSLMDLATIGARELKRQGKLDNLDASEEVNACSIIIDADIDGKVEPWLIMFKNETHNHPTEIEPFGGASTCLGGAIRDPLSGRSYAYQAMRITGAGNPHTPIDETLPGKLPQRQITRAAAAGYSSYGNQIGLSAGKVQEYYHPGFVAKRMELGAIVAAAPQSNVRRAQPEPGDMILLIGGRTGRDGCGGATGSSKAHTDESLQTCGAEVQKGNPLIERNIQRLFRQAEFARLVKRCNDFGAGGVCVAIGELAAGLAVDLDAVPCKYEGLDGTELAISESQERMAAVISPADLPAALQMARAENLEATVVARVSSEPRLRMHWRGKTIVDLARSFLDTNGVRQHATAKVNLPERAANPFLDRDISDLKEAWLSNLADLNVCSQKGLSERFDATVGAATVLSPWGGKKRLTPNEVMAAKLPVDGQTNTCTLMSHGYDPQLSSWSPYHGALYAVVEANAKIAAAGGDVRQVRMSFQEYFERLGDEPARWGKPLAALLGGLRGQLEFGTASIGGKDSMSGSFNDLSVPPTLVAFAVTAAQADKVISPEFKGSGHAVGILPVKRDASFLPDFAQLRNQYQQLREWIEDGEVLAAHTVGYGGIAATLSKMCFGNWLGVAIDSDWRPEELFRPEYGAIIIESEEPLPGVLPLGATSAAPLIICNSMILELQEAVDAWQKTLENIFPTTLPISSQVSWHPCNKKRKVHAGVKTAQPRVLIPVFPGTHCEFETAQAFQRAGAIIETVLLRNLEVEDIEDSIADIVKGIEQAQIVAFPGGASGGAEPDGSAKFITTVFRKPQISEAMMRLLQDRDGLVLGICDGFQALIKLGLVPYGEIRSALEPDDPTLTFNNLGRHVATTVNTVVTSTMSPWLKHATVGQVHAMPVSHGEGRFHANQEQVQQLFANGQIAFQYADLDGRPASSMPWNPNGSVCAVEGITSPDGRVLGKMGHSERSLNPHIAINIPGDKNQGIFTAGVEYFA
jgi:phosphoribosylformylglycinamidine synthase